MRMFVRVLAGAVVVLSFILMEISMPDGSNKFMSSSDIENSYATLFFVGALVAFGLSFARETKPTKRNVTT